MYKIPETKESSYLNYADEIVYCWLLHGGNTQGNVYETRAKLERFKKMDAIDNMINNYIKFDKEFVIFTMDHFAKVLLFDIKLRNGGADIGIKLNPSKTFDLIIGNKGVSLILTIHCIRTFLKSIIRYIEYKNGIKIPLSV